MGRMLRSCLQSLLKLVNSVIGLAGTGLILFALWMLRAWSKKIHGPGPSDASPPWFIYTILGLGAFLCLIACSGHIAAETGNGHCLSCYMIIVFVLVILEGAIAADIILNRNWEQDFPVDPTGEFGEFKKFVRSNFEMCEGIALAVVAAQASSILLSLVLRALGPEHGSYYDSDDDSIPARLPLLRNQAQNAPYSGERHFSLRSDPWNVSK